MDVRTATVSDFDVNCTNPRSELNEKIHTFISGCSPNYRYHTVLSPWNATFVSCSTDVDWNSRGSGNKTMLRSKRNIVKRCLKQLLQELNHVKKKSFWRTHGCNEDKLHANADPSLCLFIIIPFVAFPRNFFTSPSIVRGTFYAYYWSSCGR